MAHHDTFTRDFLKRQRLLVVSPHADDETAGAGGLMARVKEAGGKVYVLVVSVGDLHHFDPRHGNRKVKGGTRSRELAAAMKVLDADDFEILFEDTELHLRLDTMPRRDLVGWIERKARLSTENVKPTMIVLPAPSFNQDHQAIYEAGITVCRPHLASMKSFQSFVLVADAPQLSWSGSSHFRPNFYVDITGEPLRKKLRAYACHRSQIRPAPHQAGVDALRLQALTRGREISVEAAEAYECLRFVL